MDLRIGSYVRKTSGYTNTCAATSESFSHHQNYKKNVKNAKISPGRHDHRHSLHAGNNRFVGGETNTISFFVRVQWSLCRVNWIYEPHDVWMMNERLL